MSFKFINRYPDWLPPEAFFRQKPMPMKSPVPLLINTQLAQAFGIDPEWLASGSGTAMSVGHPLPPGADPMALAYAGHQFGTPVPQLGDGRALLLGQLPDQQGVLHDFQLKGSGPTPFSRMGDGRAALGPVLRELLVSEAMHALGIPTSRVLITAKTGEAVLRQTGPEPGAILTRVARSHLRFGTFEYFINRHDLDGLKAAADAAIAWHYPELAEYEAPARYRVLLERVIEHTITLVTEWLRVGFIHGVMNTDNMMLSGETLDYGPCAFMDHFSAQRVFSSVDRGGRYAFNRQPYVAHWNLARLAECLLPLMEEDALESVIEIINAVPDQFQAGHDQMMRRKLGLLTEQPTDTALGEALLAAMEEAQADYTNTFSAIGRNEPPAWMADWWLKYEQRLGLEPDQPRKRQSLMAAANPVVIPRNHLVERALHAAENGDLSPAENLLAVIQSPYQDPGRNAQEFLRPPQPDEIIPATFCGT
ncbi:MAG: YdiU family protein [Gammaproteobacteria bacterium]|nr:YdiU family protein [Gammaproteobacteria bacterium]